MCSGRGLCWDEGREWDPPDSLRETVATPEEEEVEERRGGGVP